MSDYGSKQGKATSPELVALEARVRALEASTYQRGKDVDIGQPPGTERQSTRVPRLILVDIDDGQRYWVRIRAGAWQFIPL